LRWARFSFLLLFFPSLCFFCPNWCLETNSSNEVLKMGNRRLALRALNLEKTERIPHWEYLANPDFETYISGVDAIKHPQQAHLRLLKKLDIDVIWNKPPMADDPIQSVLAENETTGVNENGEKVAKWGAGTTWGWEHGGRFANIDDVIEFDAHSFIDNPKRKIRLEDLGTLSDWIHLPEDELAAELNREYLFLQSLVGETSQISGRYYRTLFLWPLMLFGWELFSELAYLHENEFLRIWKEFFAISLKVTKAYGKTEVPVVMSHDDICMTKGPIFNPSWYRKNLYKYYEELWEPIKKTGKKVIFVSDGNLDDVIEDVLAAGADGFIAEPYTDIEKVAKKHPEKIIIGNVDSRILLFGTNEDIKNEVRRCALMGKELPGYFYCVSNLITWNIPTRNIELYFNLCSEYGMR
jgi:hypothetical protein